MWSHYGRAHRGIIIEFDVQGLKDSAIEANLNLNKPVANPDAALLKVRYEPRFPPISVRDVIDFYKKDDLNDAKKTRLISYVEKTLAIKAKVWEYEHEWRMLWHSDDTAL
jgi:hypothetical protein